MARPGARQGKDYSMAEDVNKIELPDAKDIVEALKRMEQGGESVNWGIVPGKDDLVNHPKHYLQGKIEVIDFIDDQKLGFYEGQVIKYICRAKHKNAELQDLKKAQFYLNRLIKQKEEGNK